LGFYFYIFAFGDRWDLGLEIGNVGLFNILGRRGFGEVLGMLDWWEDEMEDEVEGE
jgi:hypothetical protein